MIVVCVCVCDGMYVDVHIDICMCLWMQLSKIDNFLLFPFISFLVHAKRNRDDGKKRKIYAIC